jgi:hypothetical protein
LASSLGAAGLRVLGAESVVLPIAIPALVLSGWAAVGHLVTLDDDLSGGWSNPDGDSRAAWLSVAELLVKLGLFIIVALVVWAGRTA